MSIRGWQAWLTVSLVGALTACGGPTGPVFIALTSDFADYQTWERVKLGDGTVEGLTGHPVGPRIGYRNMKPVNGVYPVGAILLKVITTSDGEEFFALSKRGGGFNGGGALDWEYLTLKTGSTGAPVVFTRGDNPADPDSAVPNSHGYGDPTATGVTCNRCHGVLGSERTDHVLSPVWP